MTTTNASGAGMHAIPLIYPALHLQPLNDTFVPKQISLVPVGAKVKIGRQTNAKTIPNPTNGYFDSKVLSRMHAEVWCEDDTVFIKDVKSSNGTFINGERLSAEAVESEVFKLRSEDIVEFGIDIVSDDNKTIVHHKVATKIYIAITSEDALHLSQTLPAIYRANEINLGRRYTKGGVANTGLSYDHVLHRLQNELQKSRETGSDLGNLAGQMNEIQDSLGGHLPPTHAVSGRLPNGVGAAPAGADEGAKDGPHASTIAALQNQLSETQSSLASHIVKFNSLEYVLTEHEAMKNDFNSLREQMGQARRELGLAADAPQNNGDSNLLNGSRSSDDDDASSIASDDTVIESQPTPNRVRSIVNGIATHGAPELVEQNAALTNRMNSLTSDLESATAMSQALRSEHAQALETVRTLEERVQDLEKAVKAKSRAEETSKAYPPSIEAWKSAFEDAWRKERLSWEEERRQLRAIIKQWEDEHGASASSGSEAEETEETPTLRKTPSQSGKSSPAASSKKSKKRRKAPSKTLVESVNEFTASAATGTGEKATRSRRYDDKDLTMTARHRLPDSQPPDKSSRTGLPPTGLPSNAATVPMISATGIVLIGVAAWLYVNKDT
ncbi:hypothetical protein E5Q_04205 [Mixia osmundae IAM 14324]|uniref:FHA domain-containing protein n=1 Tax=Mixia osmundae (strain CBS 9802 / IAM 14324 / JCM 22182 / KY 12970) TaxID=764103 RepID=G7E3W7_MIXOS|nr:hypothetical protein E5Q_04205 [Mixia osmundae IAM 14324]